MVPGGSTCIRGNVGAPNAERMAGVAHPDRVNARLRQPYTAGVALRTERVTGVRPATAADIPRLVGLMAAFYAESSYPLDGAWATAAFACLLDAPARGAVWLAEVDGVAAGHVVLTVRHAMEYGGLCGIVDDLYVEPAHRRGGVATALLDALLDDCRRRRCLAVTVEVGASNAPAQALYRRAGLRPADDDRQLLRAVLPVG